jgi:hypothetical protein
MDIIATIGIDAEAKPVADKTDCSEPLFASHVSIFVYRRVPEIEPRQIGKIHPMFGEIEPPLGLVPAYHLI